MAAIKTIAPQDLSSWLEEGKEVSILDIRPAAERAEWHIPNSIHIDTYEHLKAGNAEALDNLPIEKSVPVVTYCAGGNLSRFATEVLSERGYDSYSLEGGMKAWNYAYDTALLEFAGYKIIQVRRVAKGCLSYIIGSGSDALVVDASLDPTIYDDLAKAQGWEIKFATDTHIHADYISRTKELAAFTGAKHLMIDIADVEFPFVPIANGESIPVGGKQVNVIHTAGHTWESTTFAIDKKVLLTGDTLFTDGIGRPDLKADETEAERKAKALFDSLQLIMTYPEDTLILPAHVSKPITIGQAAIVAKLDKLKDMLPVLSLPIDKFLESALSKLPAPPSNFLTIAAINRSGNTTGIAAADLETGANRCAIR